MPHSRFFLDTPLQANTTALLSGDEAHHLQHVMRKTDKERVELINGRNQIGVAQILSFEKNGIRLQLVDVENKSPPPFPIILCQAIPRLNRLDAIVEKGTELGMTELWLFPAERSEKKELSSTQCKRLEMIAIAAMEQCGRLDLPKILLKPPLGAWDKLDLPAYYGDPDPSSPSFLSCYHKGTGIAFFIGPESGFSRQEEAYLRHLHVEGVHLHTNVLRTDTASIVALSLISN